MALDQTSGSELVTPVPDPRRYWALAIIAVSQLMIVLDASVVIVALPSAQRALHISVADRQWVMSAYTLAFGSLLLLGGRIADYLGRRRMFFIGLLGFAAASALGGLAQTQAMLFGARALQGAFAAVMAPAALSLLTVTFTEPHERARAFGVYGGIAGGGAAIGLVLGGTLTQFASWRWTLLINVPIALIAAFAVTRVIKESKGVSRAGYDLPGAATVTAGLFLLVYGFTVAATDGWGSPTTIGLLVGAVVLLCVFVVLELRSPHPLLPLRVVLDRNRGGAYLAGLLVGSAMLGTFLFLTYFFQGTLHYSALKTGFAFLPFSGGIIVGRRRVQPTAPAVRSPAADGLRPAAGYGRTPVVLPPGRTQHLWRPRTPARDPGQLRDGCDLRPMSSTALVGVDPKDAGVASALVNTTQQVGGSLGTALLNTIAASAATAYLVSRVHSVGDGRAAVVHGYTTAFTVSAGLLLLAAVASGTLIRASRHDLAVESDEPAVDPALAGAPV